ncbi:hypothetical protein HY969_02755 [Candidatus Kaiserbacteria bacterium]|nr:hypothetical protein [Candidatus Kaiserbacteria bacterium]
MPASRPNEHEEWEAEQKKLASGKKSRQRPLTAPKPPPSGDPHPTRIEENTKKWRDELYWSE